MPTVVRSVNTQVEKLKSALIGIREQQQVEAGIIDYQHLQPAPFLRVYAPNKHHHDMIWTYLVLLVTFNVFGSLVGAFSPRCISWGMLYSSLKKSGQPRKRMFAAHGHVGKNTFSISYPCATNIKNMEALNVDGV